MNHCEAMSLSKELSEIEHKVEILRIELESLIKGLESLGSVVLKLKGYVKEQKLEKVEYYA